MRCFLMVLFAMLMVVSSMVAASLPGAWTFHYAVWSAVIGVLGVFAAIAIGPEDRS